MKGSILFNDANIAENDIKYDDIEPRMNFNMNINQCKYYDCDTSDASATLKCHSSLSTYPMKYAMQIDNDDLDHAVIDKVLHNLAKMHEISSVPLTRTVPTH